MTDNQFYEFCRLNPELRIERRANGDIIFMPPTGGETGRKNALLLAAFVNWDITNQSGVTFDSSTGFILPNGATRSPDLAWVKKSRFAALEPEQKRKFIPFCPDFVLELRSQSDSIAALKEKMREYVANGAQLAWLIDVQTRTVFVYHADGHIEMLENAESISGEPVLQGLRIDLRSIWEIDF
ncbi:MAG: hypothetical protein DMF61_06255 [Blastocatellia bacterium AA13]|nr:MAG: hypothetical protein DMF61_06255 [Blastocatellia bacterium AA13]